MSRRFSAAAFAVASLLLTSSAGALACSGCGCSLSSDWASQGFALEPGLRFDLRYDYLDQNQLRTGRHPVDRSQFPLPQDREMETFTRNHYVTLGVDTLLPGADWGVNVQLPYVGRNHATVPEGGTDVVTSSSHSIGDVRVIGRYQGFAASRNVGIQFGLKLPTGDHRRTFDNGEILDRGLQPGTGTLDALIGGFYFASIGRNWDVFAQALALVPTQSKDSFRPGTTLTLNAGFRFAGFEGFAPQIQINTRSTRRDTGADADTANSGGTLVYLSPGITVDVAKSLTIYSFLQIPVYQNVNGFQLLPRATVSVGVRYAL